MDAPAAPPLTPWLLTRNLPETEPDAPRGARGELLERKSQGPSWDGPHIARPSSPLPRPPHAPPVYCIPPAGQGAWVFGTWAKALAPGIAVRSRQGQKTQPGARVGRLISS
jgi:hypothetical protein